MPKLKTHKGTKKVLNIRQSGSIKIGKPGSRHNTGKKPASFSRSCANGSALDKTELKRIKSLIVK